ncbi:hypothetical protein Q3G72_030135 [Acer saccharum]|nr:hypothetical protein Q3G72_030135 [Acer saccharum]
MWINLSFDVLSNIFSFLSPDSLARASSVCHHWHTCVHLHSLPYSTSHHHHFPWFLAFPARNRCLCCYVQNPVTENWQVVSLDFLPDPARPVTSIGSLLLLRPTNCTLLRLGLCNPFTRQFKYLPMLNIARTNPAVGLVVGPAQYGLISDFKVYVAGGMSEAPCGGATYEPTLEMYDSRHDTWQIVGPMPVEFAVRLTVWTPNESVYTNGVLYWMTSARAYSLMGLDIESNTWRELSVPMADRLEFAALMRRNGKLTLIGGGMCVEGTCVWELDEEEEDWWLIEKVPIELGLRLLGGRAKWESTKCVGSDEAICLYREIGSGMVVWRRQVEDENGDDDLIIKSKSKWEWTWVDGDKQAQNVPIKGVLLHPSLALSCMLN